MPGNTTYGYPYPVGTDRVADGDDAIKALADAVQAKLGVIKSGQVATAGTVTAGTNYDLTLTWATQFPADSPGPYAVAATVGVAPDLIFAPCIIAVNKSVVSVRLRRSAGTQGMTATIVATVAGNW
jgi:hypothetical protein